MSIMSNRRIIWLGHDEYAVSFATMVILSERKLTMTPPPLRRYQVQILPDVMSHSVADI